MANGTISYKHGNILHIEFKEKHKVGCEGGLKVSLAGVFTKIGTFGNKYAGVLRSVLLLFNPKLE